MNLDTILIVPLDDPVNCFSILKQDHHGRLAVHLADEVVILRIGLLGRSRFFSIHLGVKLLFDFSQVWPDQFSVQDCLFLLQLPATFAILSSWKGTGKRDMNFFFYLNGSSFKERVTHLPAENNIFSHWECRKDLCGSPLDM